MKRPAVSVVNRLSRFARESSASPEGSADGTLSDTPGGFWSLLIPALAGVGYEVRLSGVSSGSAVMREASWRYPDHDRSAKISPSRGLETPKPRQDQRFRRRVFNQVNGSLNAEHEAWRWTRLVLFYAFGGTECSYQRRVCIRGKVLVRPTPRHAGGLG